jgi:hypothetical protein
MAEKVAELRRLSNQELIDRHDQMVTHMAGGINYYLDELARREARQKTDQMLLLTRVMAALTVAITLMTLVNVIIVA